MIEGDILKDLNRIGLKLATYDQKKDTKRYKQNRSEVSYM